MSVGSTVFAGAERPRAPHTWLRWVLANVAGESVGFGLGLGAAFALTMPLAMPEGALLAVAIVVEILIVGVIEGLAVGLAQHWVLRPLLPGLSRSAWIRATIPGAVVAWGAGMMVANWADKQFAAALDGSWPLLAGVLGILAGAILSAFQWLPLRQVARRAFVWVPAHAIAWAFGMLVAFAGISSIPENASGLTIVGTSAAVGVGMGIVVAAITGLALLWVLRGEE